MDFRKLLFSAVTVASMMAIGAEYERGTPAYEMNLESRTLMVDGVASERSALVGFDELDHAVGELDAVTSGVETTDMNLELVAGEELVAAIKLDPANPTVIHSRSTLKVESISYTRAVSQEDANVSVATTVFNLKQCVAQQDDADKDQDQNDGADAEICKTAVYTLVLKEAARQDDADQDQDDNGGQ